MSAKIDVEPMPPWLSAWLADLDVLGATEGAVDGGPDHVRQLLLHVIRDFPLDIFKSVALPTARAGEAILGIAVVRSLERHLALCALRYADLLHNSPPATLPS